MPLKVIGNWFESYENNLTLILSTLYRGKLDKQSKQSVIMLLVSQSTVLTAEGKHNGMLAAYWRGIGILAELVLLTELLNLPLHLLVLNCFNLVEHSLPSILYHIYTIISTVLHSSIDWNSPNFLVFIYLVLYFFFVNVYCPYYFRKLKPSENTRTDIGFT